MKKLITYIISIFFATTQVYGQNFDNQTIEELSSEQQKLTIIQDSLQNQLNNSRKALASASPQQRDSLSTIIVTLEGEVFDTRAQLGRIGSELSEYQEQYAQEILAQASQNSTLKNIKVYQSDKLNIQLTDQDIKILQSAPQLEKKTLMAIDQVGKLYESLCSIKEEYGTTRKQETIDSLLTQGELTIDSISTIDNTIGKEWNEAYNHILGLYIVMLNSAPNIDRTLLENIDQMSREVRRSESLIQQGSIAPLLACFELQRALLISYEDAIANVILITNDYSLFENSELDIDLSTLKEVEFEARQLTLYSQVIEDYEYSYTSADDIEIAILPSGLYYSIQVAMLSKPATSLSMFRNAGPLQVNITPQGKYRYMIGGFRNYKEAEDNAAKLKNIGFRVPTVVAFVNGEYTSLDKAKKLEDQKQSDDKYKIVITSKNAESGDILTTAIEMHSINKNISKIMASNNYIFTVSEFESKEEAEALVLILKEKDSDSTIEVEKITL